MPRLPQHAPSTPRPRPRPSASPLASSLPFDWDAAVNNKPPPYATPASQRRLRKRSSIGVAVPAASPAGSSAHSTPLSHGAQPRRVYRTVSIRERFSNSAWQLFYAVQDFPQERMPAPQTVARVVGAALHLTHLVVRYTKFQRVKDDDLAWEDMLGEIDIPGVPSADPWFDWTTPAALLLVTASLLNAVYLFTRIKFYHLFSRPDLTASPSAELVDREDLGHTGHLEPPLLLKRILMQSRHILRLTWSFLLGTPSPASQLKPSRKVQRLSVWAPEEGEMLLFIIYSPLHALLWQAVSPGNWILMLFLLGVTSALLYIMHQRYTILLKDREIVAAEVLHEYDEKFVFPHIMRVRRDVGVMTHEAEVISFR